MLLTPLYPFVCFYSFNPNCIRHPLILFFLSLSTEDKRTLRTPSELANDTERIRNGLLPVEAHFSGPFFTVCLDLGYRMHLRNCKICRGLLLFLSFVVTEFKYEDIFKNVCTRMSPSLKKKTFSVLCFGAHIY
jgi:hypothetical protein